jgi:hypothetical protein
VFRRSFTAGLAIAGAGAITWSAVGALPGEEPVAVAPRVVVAGSQSVALTGYAETLVAGAVAALEQSVDGLANDFPAIWSQVNAQWPDAELLHWNYALVADSFLAPVAPLVIGPLNDAVAEVLADAFPDHAEAIGQLPGLVEYTTVRLVGPLLSAIGAAGIAHEGIYYPTTTGDVAGFFEGIAAAPGHVIDGLLVGGYGDLSPLVTGEVGGTPIPAPGLLTPWGQEPPERDVEWGSTPGAEVPETTEELLGTEVPEDVEEDPNPLSGFEMRFDWKRPAIETSIEASVTEEAAAETVDTHADANVPSEAPKPRASLRQGIRDIRAGVRESVKRAVQGSRSAEAESSEAESTESETTKKDTTSGDEARQSEAADRADKRAEKRAEKKSEKRAEKSDEKPSGGATG